MILQEQLISYRKRVLKIGVTTPSRLCKCLQWLGFVAPTGS